MYLNQDKFLAFIFCYPRSSLLIFMKFLLHLIYFQFLYFCEKNRSSHESKGLENTSDGVHLLNKVSGLSPISLHKMKSFANICKDFAKIEIYLKLFSRTASSNCSETPPHHNFRCFDSKTNGQLISFWAL